MEPSDCHDLSIDYAFEHAIDIVSTLNHTKLHKLPLQIPCHFPKAGYAIESSGNLENPENLGKTWGRSGDKLSNNMEWMS
jgi:hypothetical protein